MDLQRWRRLQELFDAAAELRPEERRAFLDEACGDDVPLRHEVESLLESERAGAGRIEQAIGAVALEIVGSGDAGETLPPGAGDRGGPAFEGRKLGPYRVLRRVGGGGMGVIYLARDSRLHREVALKLLPPEWSRDPAAKERLFREARAASALDHPNICTVYDIGETDDGQLYIVMAYYRGETLRQRLERGPLAPEQARDLAVQVARGLERAHEAGVIHRDVKPANILVTDRDEAKILDFGIAKVAGDARLTRTGTSPGTPAYMSPEQAMGDPVDARTDIWSLGVILYEMLTGQRPFRGEHEQAVIHAILERDPEPVDAARPAVPKALAQVVARSLAKDVAQRYQSGAELLADLESSQASRARSRRRRAGARWRVVAAASGAVALAALVLWGVSSLRPEAPVTRVALLSPEVSSVGEQPDLVMVSAEVVEAALMTLASLEDIELLDPPARDEKTGSETEKLRSAEADEVLRTFLDCRQADSCRVTFRRLREPGGRVLGSTERFDVPTGVENAHQLAEAVRVYLPRAYPRHRRRSESPAAAVRSEDYEAYVELKRRSDRGQRLGSDDLDRLDRLLRTSPDLLGALLLAAGIARVGGDLERALAYAEKAHRLAPHDPRPLFNRFRIELAGRRFDEAATTLARLRVLSPGDIRVQTSQAELLEARGELEEARERRREIVRRRPSWRNILGLANLEVSLGDAASARRRLRGLLEEQPKNQWVLESLANLEAEFGDLNRAAELFTELSGIHPERVSLSNLGFVLFLLADYRAAAEAYRGALDLEPGALLARFNLATARQAQGDLAEAQSLYRSVLGDLERASGDLDAQKGMLKAQCLARIGRHAEALDLAEAVLKRRPEEVQILHQAAQIYSLLGERVSALYYVERCVKKGLRREWLEIPAFDPMQADPKFQALLESSSAGKAG